jgi:hypothetical protein
MAEYTVNLWACKPGTDDLCCCGVDVESKEEALEIYNASEARFQNYFLHMFDPEIWVEILGPDIEEERLLYNRASSPDNDDDWRRERAIQAGMGMGIDAYNDNMGY